MLTVMVRHGRLERGVNNDKVVGLIHIQTIIYKQKQQVKRACSITNSIGINFQAFMHTHNHI